MTIKEAEGRTGLARANIRYYEDHGFFSAARGENGYRNYSEENVDTLLKVKLLRQLGFSLEDVHALQKGDQALGAALEQRESGLERERQELGQAARLCREIRSDGASFYTLDARRYLDHLAREEEVFSKDQDPVRIFPWRRYFARELDYLLIHSLLLLVLQLTVRLNYLRTQEDAGLGMLLSLVSLGLMAAAETLMVTRWGATPGKFLLGLKLLREDGSKFSLVESAKRAGMAVSFYGIFRFMHASSVPLFDLIGLIPLAWAGWQAYHEKPLFWEPNNQLYLDGSDRDKAFLEKKRGWYGIAGYLAVGAACIGLMVGGHLLAARPLHRGADLTAEEFVENYNQCMVFAYGEENLSKRLRPDGTFEEIERDPGTYVIHIYGDSPVPDASFRFEGDGGLTRVILTRKYDSGGPLAEGDAYGVGIPYDEIYVAMRSLLWSRLGEKKVTSAYNDLAAAKGNYLGILNGVQINSEMRFTGYHSFGEDTLFAEAGEAQSYFVEFVMELT